ncbi:MAG: cyanophycinase [Prevotellaceae bacterium]|jgi:cyanophycinase|nr:cyanophycinase [Prevotellaceae bacterium]
MKPKAIFFVFLCTLSIYASAQSPITIKDGTTRHGPEKGSLIIIGGGGSAPDIWSKFTELAGGKEKAKIVVVTTAGDNPSDTRLVEGIKRATGITQVTALHTTDVNEANSKSFTAVLDEATGVFFGGGRQFRVADAYLNTLTHQAFWGVLERGGVIAGSSAGASIQGSILWRGDSKGPHILLGDHSQGLGFLKNAAIDQHLLRFNRQFDLLELVSWSPSTIGIGIDEATAVLVQKDVIEVLGVSYVAIYDYATITGSGERKESDDNRNSHSLAGYVVSQIPNTPFFFLSKGQKYDLKERKVIEYQRTR